MGAVEIDAESLASCSAIRRIAGMYTRGLSSRLEKRRNPGTTGRLSAMLALILCAGVLSHSRAEAQQDLEGARAAFEQAEADYADGAYALALRRFERAYELLGDHPRRYFALYNMGRCYEELDRPAEAQDAYQRALEEGARGSEQEDDVVRRLAELETRDAMRDGDAPAASPRATSPGAAPAGERPASGGGVSPVGFIVGGAGILLGGAAAVTGAMAMSEGGTLDDACSGTTCPDRPELRDARAQAETLAVATDVLWVGAAALVVGVTLIFVLDDGGNEDVRAELSCNGFGCTSELSVAF